ncbi:MAG TPA: ATP-binding protein [Candidatus Polarisedimenticolia bacterium]|nr:ATP-binding protein [Candidatus Polarisedimenticolia bacterium]
METERRCEFDDKRLLLKMRQSMPADVTRITPVVDGVMELVRGMGCAVGKEFEVETALREALANAIVHGCGKDPGKEVEFVVACDEERGMLIVVRDPGPGFDPASIPSPIQGQQVFETHGRGIYLINTLMDEVRFEKGGTEIIMKKRA